MSIYTDFADRLDEEKLERRAGIRRATIILVENEGGEPLLGIQYSGDFRYEEEEGARNMAEVFTRTGAADNFFSQEYLLTEDNKGLSEGTKQADLVINTDQLVGFATSANIYDLRRELASGLGQARKGENSISGKSELRYQFWDFTVAELKQKAKDRGIKGYSKLNRDGLIQLLVDFEHAASQEGTSQERYTQAGGFHDGQVLVFEKLPGLFTDILEKLVEAAQAGQLVVGSGGIGAFGTGFSFFDARDLTEAAKEKISAQNRWYREQMELLKPVAAVVKEGPMKNAWGSAYYFLGNPLKREDGHIDYWLNGTGVKLPNGRAEQPTGWYSLQELLDEKYMDDVRAKSDENFKTFDSKGSYRPEKLTDEQAEAELKARGLRWASKPMADD